MLIDLCSDITSWPELESRIAALPTEQRRGAVFEEFCAAYFALSALFQFKEVYHHNAIPPSLCRQLGYPENRDIGIDGLGVTHDGKLYAWQAKFRQDRSRTPTKSELATFFTFSDKADWRITITNAARIPHELDDRTRQSKVLSDKLDALDAGFFDRLREYLQSKVVRCRTPALPHRTQQEAIDAALMHFRTEDRGQLILPCGTGKTLAALWITERLVGKRFLVMVPSLSLMDQTLREWAANTSLRPFRYQCLCSDTSVDLGHDSPIEHICDMEVPVTTDAGSVADFLLGEPDIPSVLFCTYQSGKVLAEAARQSGNRFDVAIFDEAHRTTGAESLWGLALDDANVPISKRIFMTATPRIYAPHITKKAQENDVLLCSMDDHALYGIPFFEMTFGDAIERGHITDYRIVVVCVTDREIQQLITQGGSIIAQDQEWDVKAFAKRVALVKAIREYGLRKVFTFHGKVKSADAFTSHASPSSIGQVARILDQPGQQIIPECFHVHGGMSSGVRKGYIEEFKKADIGIMSNARCLTEGVDVPAVDAVAFIDPKRSLIDIVQATGRALRLPPKGSGYTKEKGYIFIPVFVEDGADPEKFLESSDFDSVWKVIQAMKDQDQRLEDLVSQLQVMQGKGEEGTQDWKAAMVEYGEKVAFFNLPVRVDQDRFAGTLYTKTLEIVGQSWAFWYGLLKKFVGVEKHAMVNKVYITANGYKLGSWVSRQRNNKNKLSHERIKLLEALPEWSWNTAIDNWNQGYECLLAYAQKEGHFRVNVKVTTSDGFKLGQWVARQRAEKEEMPQERIARLEALPGWCWDARAEKWEVGFNYLLEYVQVKGHCNVPKDYKSVTGYTLGLWVDRQRAEKEDMPQNRIDRLQALPGWSWEPHRDRWETGYNHLHSYAQENRHCLVQRDYKTSEGYKLGQWVTVQRATRYSMTQKRIERLETLQGWSWNPIGDQWQNGYNHLKVYVQKHNHCRVPQDFISEDGFKLGIWVSTQRAKQDKISQDRRELLVSLQGWTWNASPRKKQ